jgi:peptidoglycan/LPS O-acetylase OafA/YrhL
MAVIWGHAGLPGLPGAYLFIDTFFVISGYLVSRSLLQAFRADDTGARPPLKGTLLTFFGNRFRRIAIPLVAAVLLTLMAGWFILLPDDLFALATSARATLFLQAHLYALTLGNYFDVVGKSAPLLHAWSLSLEEWFYIITPVLVLPAIVWRRSWWIVIMIILVGLSLYQAQTLSTDPEALGVSYSLFRTRVWEFMLGAIAALMVQRPLILSKRLNDAAIVAGLVATFASILFLTDKAPSPGLVSLPVVIGALPVLMLKPQSRLLGKVTGSRIVTFFGRKLYSLYLAHYPFIVYFDYLSFDVGRVTDIVKFVMATVFGLLFYFLLESPKEGWRTISFRKVLTIAGALITLTLALSNHILKTGGAPTRLPDAALAAWTARFDINPHRATCLQSRLTRFGYSCALGPEDSPYFALFGDSHSDVFANQLALTLAQRGIGLRHYWYAECPTIGTELSTMNVFSKECEKLSYEAHRKTLRDPGLVGVIYAARWPWYLNNPDEDLRRAYWRDAAGLPHGYTEMQDFRDDFAAILTTSVSNFSDRGVPVYIISPVPALSFDPVRVSVLSAWGRVFPSAVKSRNATTSQLYDQSTFDNLMLQIKKTGTVMLLNSTDSLCNGLQCDVYNQDGSLYYDDNHMNEAGAKRIIGSFFKN